jgi:hypothetical protein
VIILKYDDPKMQEYFSSLPEKAQKLIVHSHIRFNTLKELEQYGEEFKNE